MKITIREGTAAEAAAFLASIPEFSDAYPLQVYEEQLSQQPHLILLAETGGAVVGCKVGYALSKECFYSWMGAVLPQWRQQGIADQLAEQQEVWARNQGYPTVRFKTRNSRRAMLHFGLRRGFNIIGVEAKETVPEHRIWLEKQL